MKNLVCALAVLVCSITAHAGFQYGEVCKDINSAVYLYSDGYAGSESNSSNFVNPTECLRGKCHPALMAIQGITSENGIERYMLALDPIETQVTDPQLSRLAGDHLRVILAHGKALVCGERRLLTDIPGQQ